MQSSDFGVDRSTYLVATLSVIFLRIAEAARTRVAGPLRNRSVGVFDDWRFDSCARSADEMRPFKRLLARPRASFSSPFVQLSYSFSTRSQQELGAHLLQDGPRCSSRSSTRIRVVSVFDPRRFSRFSIAFEFSNGYFRTIVS